MLVIVRNEAALDGVAHSLREQSGVSVPVCYKGCEPEVMMTLMETAGEYVAVLVNKAAADKRITLEGVSAHGRLLFADRGGKVNGRRISIPREGTLVVAWEK